MKKIKFKSVLHNHSVLIVLFYLLRSFNFSTYCQDLQNIDSLQNLLQTEIHDTTRVDILNSICFKIKGLNPEEAIEYGKQALSLARQIEESSIESMKDFSKRNIVRSLNNIADCYYYQGNYDEAIIYFLKSMRICEDMGYVKILAATLNSIGMVYDDQGYYAKSLEYLLKSLKITENIEDKSVAMASSYNNIGIIYWNLGELDKALEYYFNCLSIVKRFGYQKGIAMTYINIGNIHHDKKNYDMALDFFFKGMEISEEIEDHRGIALAYNNIANVYRDIGNYNRSLDYHFKSLEIKKEYAAGTLDIARSYNNIGSVYSSLNNNKKAIEYIGKGLSIAEEAGGYKQMKNAYKLIANVYSEIKDYKNAFEYHKLYAAMKDSLFNEEKSKEIGKLEAKYEMEKKIAEEKAIAEVEAKAKAEKQKRRNLLQYSGILIFIVLMFIGVFMSGRFTLPVRWAEGLVFFTFLLFFEFTLVMLDPYIERFSAGAPAIKLAFNAVLAGLIFPLHAFFEGLLKRRVLSQKKT
ncbi:MAG: tetratricopeptide repeat protein [Bacteroidota bacterium]